MHLESISIVNFRNHHLAEFQPGSGVTVIYGNNGTGKTSLLESVHYCTMTRGFAKSTDRDCLSFGKNYFTIRASFLSDIGAKTDIRIAYPSDGEKSIQVNGQELQSFSRHIGTIPCVVFSPYDMVIVNGPPSERRRFLDSAISQHDRKYLEDLLHYRRFVQQRNALLSGFMERNSSVDTLDVLTEQVAFHAASIVVSRQRFVRRFSELFSNIHSVFHDGDEAAIEYQCSLGKIDTEEGIESVNDFILRRYRKIRNDEISRRQTLAGPHRDDLLLFSGGHEVKKFSSQGRQRSYVIGMKLSMISYLHELTGEKPVNLLDDLFSELDHDMKEKVLSGLVPIGQIFITSTANIKKKGVGGYPVEALLKHRQSQE